MTASEWFGALYATAGLSIRTTELHDLDMADEALATP